MQGMVSRKKKPPFLDFLRSMSAQHGGTYKATSSWHGVWTTFAHLATEFRLINTVGASLTWTPAMRFSV